MIRKIAILAGLMTLGISTLMADFSYQETHTITGGAMMGAMKVMGVFSKQARQLREPMQSSVALKGDRMMRRNGDQIEIIDLGNQTITNIDMQKKSYSVMTFDELKQALAQMQEKMSQAKAKQRQTADGQTSQVDTNFKFAVKETGKAKQVHGFEAKEMVLTATMEMTDQQTGKTGSMVMAADEWIAPAVPGYDEVRNFYRRMAEKLNWTPNSNLFMNNPKMGQGMAEIAKESAKLDGIPVFQTIVMGPEGMQPVDKSDAPAGQSQEKGPSMKSALGNALGGKFGLGRKKEPPPEQQQQQAGGNAAQQGVLIEMTTEMSGFSSNSVDSSLFEVLAGFKKVEAEIKKGLQ